MMKQQHRPLLATHRFSPGGSDDAPLLLPLAPHGKEARAIVSFCHRIYPDAPILAPLLARVWGQNAENVLVQGLAHLIQKVGALYDLTLMPVVLVGHGDEVDLAVQVALRSAAHVAACILLRPTRSVAALPVGSLTGLAVLLAFDSQGDNVGKALHRLLATAGADVIAAGVNRRSQPGGSDVAICRIFLEALFPTGGAKATRD